MKKTIFLSTALLLSFTAFAQPPAGGPGGGQMPTNEIIMERNDANEDGEITKEEAEAAETALGTNFAMFDTDEDGIVTAEELDAVRGQMPAQ